MATKKWRSAKNFHKRKTVKQFKLIVSCKNNNKQK